MNSTITLINIFANKENIYARTKERHFGPTIVVDDTDFTTI